MAKAILVTGSRGPLWCEQEAFVCEVLSNVAGVSPLLVVGDAKGVDSVARNWFRDMCFHAFVYQADWKAHGKAAGPKRNQDMVDRLVNLARVFPWEPLVLAFPSPNSQGTWDCVRRAQDASLPVQVHNL